MHDAGVKLSPDSGKNTLIIYDHTHLRRFIGILALSIGCITVFLANDNLSSISAAYWSSDDVSLISARDFFVGGLCVVSAFLLSYRGRGNIEPWLSKIGCLASALVAFFPTAADNCEECGSDIHGFAAAVLFTILLYFILGFAHRAKCKKRYYRMWYYRICAGCIALSLVVGAYALVVLDHNARIESRIIFGVELVALIAFGLAWLWAGYYELVERYLKKTTAD